MESTAPTFRATIGRRFLSSLDVEAPGGGASKVRAYQIILALVIGTEYWIKALPRWGELRAGEAVMLGLATLLSVAALSVGAASALRRRAVFTGFAALQAWYVSSHFPVTGNHRYLELLFAALFAFLDDENEDERRWLLRSLRWTVIVVLFYSGLQKLVHGYYFQGQFLAYSMWRDTFRTALGSLLTPDELTRLVSYSGEVGDGPYLVSGAAFVALANAVWLVEITLGVLLFVRATRPLACVAACTFVVGTELVAREFMFGVEFACAVLLFARRDVLKRVVKPVAIFLALLILVRLGILPAVVFH